MPKRHKRRHEKEAAPPDHQTEIETLKSRIATSTPPPGHLPPKPNSKTPFSALPLSHATLTALTTSSFTIQTDIQHAAIPHALAGRDILASARTGSGKTLAFLIPVLERLFRNDIAGTPTLAAIVLSPTRELAVQIFMVLRSVGNRHDLSAALLIGGKKEFRKEMVYVGRTNMFVATPGRLLQHLERSPDLDCSDLEVLVLDEADRILDLGFKVQLERILEYLPRERQTMLFSATQTRRVKDLARLSLRHPEYIFVHQGNAADEKGEEGGGGQVISKTPIKLEQMYISIPLKNKLDLLFSFLSTHPQSKLIVFFSTCSQVRHAHSLLSQLRPGNMYLSCLHGKMRQDARAKVHSEFLKRDRAACMIATDIASRGLDFPKVDWVVSVDCPDGREEYVHRVGRTARYKAGGKSLLFLLPSEEEAFIKILRDEGDIKIKKWGINPSKALRVSAAAAGVVAEDVKIHDYARKAFRSYLRSYVLMPLKHVFRVEDLDVSEYAISLGLPHCPDMAFLKTVQGQTREQRRKLKNEDRKLKQLKEEIRRERLGITVNEEHVLPNNDDNDDDDWFTLKKKNANLADNNDNDNDIRNEPSRDERRQNKRIKTDGRSNAINTKITFDDEGKEQLPLPSELGHNNITATSTVTDLAAENEDYVKQIRQRLATTKELDKQREKERRKQMRIKRKMKDRDDEDEEEEDIPEADDVKVVLGGADSEPSSSSESSSSSSDSSASDSSSSSDDDDDDDDRSGNSDNKAQEDLALTLIRNMK